MIQYARHFINIFLYYQRDFEAFFTHRKCSFGFNQISDKCVLLS